MLVAGCGSVFFNSVRALQKELTGTHSVFMEFSGAITLVHLLQGSGTSWRILFGQSDVLCKRFMELHRSRAALCSGSILSLRTTLRLLVSSVGEGIMGMSIVCV